MSTEPGITCNGFQGNGGAVEAEPSLGRAFDANIRRHIDLVDRLRSLGLDKELPDLPCIVVVGDQSSGKSSILEATSGVQLPRGTGMCTRCALEMQLKKTSGSWSARLSYTKDGKETKKDIRTPEEVGPAVSAAQETVRGSDAISSTRLILSVSSPDCPDLTMIDLPGIVHNHEDPRVTKGIRDLIDNYVKRSGAIILCVIPASSDLENNEARGIARKEDPGQIRTIGVLTKCDLVDRGDDERVMQIVENRQQPLKLGYVMVRCRSVLQVQSKTSLREARAEEKDFFETRFKKVQEKDKGIDKLSERLTRCLVESIKRSLPGLVEDARAREDALRREKEELGHGLPTEPLEKKRYLQEKLDRTRELMKEALGEGIRVPTSILKSENVEVEEKIMYNTSHLWRTLFRFFATEIDILTSSQLNLVKGNLHCSAIKKLLEAYRGTELPKFPKYKVLTELVQDHIKNYEEPAFDCLNETADGVERIAKYVCEQTLEATPGLRRYMEEKCSKVLHDCRNEAKKMVERDIAKEKLVFSQDKTYLRELEAVESAKQRKVSGDSRTLSDSGSESILSFQVLSHGKENGEEHNAMLMQKLIQVYLEVANRRFVDNVPLTIRLSLYGAFVEEFRRETHSILATDEAVDLLEEDQERAEKRQEVHERLSRLTECLKLLKKEM